MYFVNLKVNPVRELRSLTVCANGGFKPPSALSLDNRRLKSAAFSNGVKTFFLINALFLTTAFVYAETIILKSGKTVEGTITEETSDSIKCDVGEGIIVTYYKDEIERREKTKERKREALSAPQKTEKEVESTNLKTMDDTGKWVAFYYQHKDINNFIPAIKIVLEEKGIYEDNDHANPVIHFFATVLKNNKTLLPQIKDLSKEYSDNAQEMLLKIIKEAENFKSPVPKDPKDLDCLWSEFFATGSPEPIKKIISVITYTENDIDLSSLVWAKMDITSKPMALKLLQSAAGWSLNSNAQQHKKVHEIIEIESRNTENEDLKIKLTAVLENKGGKPRGPNA
jgi:hypothetical protein